MRGTHKRLVVGEKGIYIISDYRLNVYIVHLYWMFSCQCKLFLSGKTINTSDKDNKRVLVPFHIKRKHDISYPHTLVC